MAHVFISYKHEDVDFVEELKRRLTNAGFIYWIDKEHIRPGESWRKGIDEAVRAALAVVVVMTPDAAASPYVTYEWSFGYGVGKTIITLLLKDTPQLHPRLEDLEYLEFRSGRVREWDRLLQELIVLHEKYEPTHVAVNAAVDALNIPKAADQQEAIKTLMKMSNNSSHALNALCDAVKHPNDAVQYLAVEALCNLKKPETMHVLIYVLQNGGMTTRSMAAKTLGVIGDETTVGPLIESMSIKGSRVARDAAEALTKIGGDVVRDAFIDRLTDGDPDIRILVAQKLEGMGDRKAVPMLITTLSDPNPTVRVQAASALEALADTSAVPSLIERLKDENVDVRLAAAAALGRLGDRSAVPGLTEAVKDESIQVAKVASWALALIDNPSIEDVLEFHDL